VVISFGLFICLSKEWLVLRISVLLVAGELREKFKLASVIEIFPDFIVCSILLAKTITSI